MSLFTYEQVEKVLEKARFQLKKHGGNIELIAINTAGVILLKFKDSCSNCKNASATIHNIIEKVLIEQLQGISSIQVIL